MASPPEIESSAGLELYVTSAPPCEAKLRTYDEDFRVEEILRDVDISPNPFPGSIPLYKAEKKSIDTLHLERSLSAVLKSRVSYAGIKDKRAWAVQFLSATSSRSAAPLTVVRPDFRCDLVGYLRRPLSRSMVAGNRFQIVLRECCSTIGESIRGSLKTCENGQMPNFYGLQRFGARDSRTHLIGRALVLAEFEQAVRMILCEPRGADDDATREARGLMSARQFEAGLSLLPQGQDIERIVARSMAKRPGDFLGAIRAIPITLRRLYVHAFQSFVFNRTLSLALRKRLDISRAIEGDNWGEVSADGLSLKKVHGVREPLLGTAVPLIQLVGYTYRNYGSRFDQCTQEVLGAEGVSAKNFFVKQMQEVSAEGGFRRAHMTVNDASCELQSDTAVLRFTLARGEYATVLLREIVKPSDPSSAGFD